MHKKLAYLCLIFNVAIAWAVAPNAVTDPTTQPDLVTGCNLYKGVAVADSGKKATKAPAAVNVPLDAGVCKINLETLLAKGEKTTIGATFINNADGNESVLSNIVSVSRPADPPASPWTGAAIDVIKGEIYASSYQIATSAATDCAYSIDNAAFIEIPLVKTNSSYSVCKIPLSGSGKHILYYGYVYNGAWGRLEGKKAGFAYTLPACQ